MHHRGKKSDDPFLTRSLTAEVGKVFGKPSSGDAQDDAEKADSSLLADVRSLPGHV